MCLFAVGTGLKLMVLDSKDIILTLEDLVSGTKEMLPWLAI